MPSRSSIHQICTHLEMKNSKQFARAFEKGLRTMSSNSSCLLSSLFDWECLEEAPQPSAWVIVWGGACRRLMWRRKVSRPRIYIYNNICLEFHSWDDLENQKLDPSNSDMCAVPTDCARLTSDCLCICTYIIMQISDGTWSCGSPRNWCSRF